MLEVGSYIGGKYKILNVIGEGEGGMSTVYLALDEKLNKTWAIKVAQRNGMKDDNKAIQGLVADKNTLINLEHKFLPRIVDVFEPSHQNQIRTQLATVLEGVVSQQLIPRKDKTGLVAASEVMIVNPAIRNLIREGKHYQVNSIIQTSQSLGMQQLEADLARLAKSDIISMEEAVLRSQDQQLLNQYLNRR